MIVRPAEGWLRLLFVWNGSVLPSIVPQLVFFFFVSLLALVTDDIVLGYKIPLNSTPFALVGLTLAIFLAFRNNASFQRYLEARALWGHALTGSRSLVSLILCYAPEARAGTDVLALVKQVIAFNYALKDQVRRRNGNSASEFPTLHYPAATTLHDIRRRSKTPGLPTRCAPCCWRCVNNWQRWT